MDVRTSHELVAQNKLAKGFNRDVPTELSLLQEEIAELLRACRHAMPGVPEELADVAIYFLGLAGILEVELQADVEAKTARGASRRYELSGARVPVKVVEERS